MRSKTTRRFRTLFRRLPAEIRRAARASYRLWKANPSHNSLEFKEIKIGQDKSLWSVRVTRGYRALGGFREEGVIEWGWIGSHSEYDKIITARRAAKMDIAG